MRISEVKKPNKYVTLGTYLLAVVCLLFGLFLPLFDDSKGILALQLPDAFNSLIGQHALPFDSKAFTLSYPIALFGSEKITFDFMALIVLIYAVITLLSLLALIPIGFSFKKDTRTGAVFAYIIEVAAGLVLSIFLVVALHVTTIKSYSIVIAFVGTILALIVLSIADRGVTGVAKLFLFLFSLISLLLLFSITAIIPKLEEPLQNLGDKIHLYPYFWSEEVNGIFVGATGRNYITLLFNGLLGDYINLMPDAKNKASAVFCTIVALVVLINYLIDLISLATKGKKVGHIFNMARYALEVATIICLIVTLLIIKFTTDTVKIELGLFLVIIAVFAVIQLLMSVIRFLLFRKKKAEPEVIKVKKQKTVNDLEEIRIVRKAEPKERRMNAEQLAFIDPPPRPAPEPIIMDIEDEARPDGGEQLTISEEPELEPVRVKEAPPPVREVQPERKPEPARKKPVEEVVKPAPAPEPVRVQPAPPPVREVQPEPQPAVQQGNVETRIYTINTIYGGPTDDFLRKLSNDEKIEFARTFIEKSNGAIGNIPDYVIGGNNKNFFSSVFIYLGRIRGMISDNLLNKMYKELNMM